MKENNALIGVEIAGYYPDVTLSGLAGVVGNPFKGGFGATNPMWSYALSVTQTLFNGGLTAAQVEAARDTYQASVATYRQTVLTAFQQIEDQLSLSALLAKEAGVQVEAVKAAEQAVQIALNEYRAGTQNFTTVVTAEATALADEEAHLDDQEQRVLGGCDPDRRAWRRLGRGRNLPPRAQIVSAPPSLRRRTGKRRAISPLWRRSSSAIVMLPPGGVARSAATSAGGPVDQPARPSFSRSRADPCRRPPRRRRFGRAPASGRAPILAPARPARRDRRSDSV